MFDWIVGLMPAASVDSVLASFARTIKQLENICLVQTEVEKDAMQEAREAEQRAARAADERTRAYLVAKKLRALIEA